MSDQATILLVEDQEDDIFMITRAFERGCIANPLRVVRDGEEAIAYLSGNGIFADRGDFPMPGLVLLDLELPRLNGFDVLRWIRQQPQLSALRVIVLTASSDTRDLNLAYQLGANSFLVKSEDFQQLVALGRTLSTFWLPAIPEPPSASAPTDSKGPAPPPP
jgi:CheY-like chemotaxis protein